MTDAYRRLKPVLWGQVCDEWIFSYPLVVVATRLIVVAVVVLVAIFTATFTAILVFLILFVFHNTLLSLIFVLLFYTVEGKV